MTLLAKLNQLDSICAEIMELERLKQQCEDNIAKLSDTIVKDKVKGGLGGEQGFYIEGIPEKEYKRRYKALERTYNSVENKKSELEEVKTEVEIFINSIEDSRARRIFRKIYMERKTQEQVAEELSIDRSYVSKIMYKYINAEKDSIIS